MDDDPNAKPLLLFGGKATKLWLGYGENVTRWNGHWTTEDGLSASLREQRRLANLSAKSKSKKMTLKRACQLLLSHYDVLTQAITMPTVIPSDQLQAIRDLLAPKESTP